MSKSKTEAPPPDEPAVTSQEVLDFLSAQPSDAPAEMPQVPEVALPPVREEYQWFVDDPSHGRVEVDAEDRDIYLKAALNDTPFVWRFALFNNRFVVSIRSITAFEREVISRALTLDSPENSWLGLNQIHDRQQGFAVCMSAQAVNGVELPNVRLIAGKTSLEDGAKQVRDAYLQSYQNMNHARYQLLLNAVRIFTIKERICDIALARDHFWSTAGDA